VGVVDHGARPMPLASCGIPALTSPGPCLLGHVRRPRSAPRRLRFGFFATRSGTTAEMKASCLAVPGFPVEVLGLPRASDASYFDPLASRWTRRNQASPRASTCAVRWGPTRGAARGASRVRGPCAGSATVKRPSRRSRAVLRRGDEFLGRAPQAGRESARARRPGAPARRNGPASARGRRFAGGRRAGLAPLADPVAPASRSSFAARSGSEGGGIAGASQDPPTPAAAAATAAAPGVDEARVRLLSSPGPPACRLPRPARPRPARCRQAQRTGVRRGALGQLGGAQPLPPSLAGLPADRSSSPGDSTICTWRRTWICSPPSRCG